MLFHNLFTYDKYFYTFSMLIINDFCPDIIGFGQNIEYIKNSIKY